MQQINRRSFLALGVGAIAWACSRGGDEPSASDEPSGGAGAISIIATAPQLVVGDTRQAFAVFRGDKPIRPKGSVKARLVTPDGKDFAVDADREEIGFGVGGDEGTTEVTDIFVVRHDFDSPGAWNLEVTAEGGSGSAAFAIIDETTEVTVDKRAPATQSPTTSSGQGVDPICTRDPACSMHNMTIAQAVASGKPSVIIFGTPAYCTSRTCGPVVDIIEDQAKNFDDVNFIHVEVWKDDDDAVGDFEKGQAPAFSAWGLQTEPWTYFVGSDGVVKDRWLGALGSSELKRAIADLK